MTSNVEYCIFGISILQFLATLNISVVSQHWLIILSVSMYWPGSSKTHPVL